MNNKVCRTIIRPICESDHGGVKVIVTQICPDTLLICPQSLFKDVGGPISNHRYIGLVCFDTYEIKSVEKWLGAARN